MPRRWIEYYYLQHITHKSKLKHCVYPFSINATPLNRGNEHQFLLKSAVLYNKLINILQPTQRIRIQMQNSLKIKLFLLFQV